MDTLYVGDIPLDYNYAVYGSNYIDLYNTNYISSGSTVTYYRVYFYDNTFVYSTHSRTAGYNGVTLNSTEIETTNDIWYRRDIDSILISVFVIAVFFAFLINLVTSMVKKGGLLGGLL